MIAPCSFRRHESGAGYGVDDPLAQMRVQGCPPAVAVGLPSGQRGMVVKTQVSAEPDDARRHGRSAGPAPHLASSLDVDTMGS